MISSLNLVPAPAAPAVRVVSLQLYREKPSAGSQALYDRARQSFLDEMRRSGFREGQGIVFESVVIRDDRSNADRLQAIAASKPELVVAWGNDAMAWAARSLTPDTRVVYALVFSPPPGDHPNMAGVTVSVPPGEQLQALQAVDPAVRRVGVVYQANNTVSSPVVALASRGASQLGLTVQAVPVSHPEEIDAALDSLQGKVDALWMVPDSISGTQKVLDWAAEHHLPVMGISDAYVESGALLALFPDFGDMGRQAAEAAARILRSTPPATVGVRSPRRTQLWINDAVRRQLGIATPPAVLQTADRVVGGGAH